MKAPHAPTGLAGCGRLTDAAGEPLRPGGGAIVAELVGLAGLRTGARVLDVGCGGGILSEPMARLGAQVVGADAAPKNIEVARLHADQVGLDIDYRAETAEALLAAGESFDAVLAMEIVEHVAEPPAFVQACHDLLRPGGVLVMSTLNRTARSFAAAIVGAEWVMRWLPKGTHEWSRFITPEELAAMMQASGLKVVDRRGMVFNPLSWGWSLSDRDMSVNYAATGVRVS